MKDFLTPSTKEFISTLPHLVWVCAPDGPCAFLSTQWVEYTGKPEEQQLGYAWLDAIHPEDRERVEEAWKSNARTLSAFLVDFRIRRHDGTYRWFKTRALPVLDGQGNCRYWVGTNTDVQFLIETQDSLLETNVELEKAVSERSKHLAEALAEARSLSEQLEEAQAVSRTGSWSLSIESGEFLWSRQLFASMGIDPAEGAPSVEEQKSLMAEESWIRLTQALERTTVTGEPYELELEFHCPDNKRCIGLARGRVRRDENGKVTHLVGTFQDISELRLARDRLSDAHQTLRLATERTGTGIWDYDLATDKVKIDPTLCRQFGLGEELAACGLQDWVDRFVVDGESDLKAEIQKGIETGREFDLFVTTKSSNRESLHIEIVGSPLHRGGSRVVGLTRDVTSDVLAKKRLQHTQALLRQFVKHAPAAIAMLDKNLCYLEVSDRWILDYDLGGVNLIGRCHYDVFPDIPDTWKQIHQRTLEGNIERREEDPFERDDGSTVWLQWECQPWYTGDGEVGGIIFFTQVITERKEMEFKLLEQQDALYRSNRDLENFAHAASHDLQTPLRAVCSCVEMLQYHLAETIDPEVNELLEHISQGAERMRRLVKGILNYSKVEQDFEFKTVDLEQVLGVVLSDLMSMERYSEVRIEIQDLPDVWGSEPLIISLYKNLLENAVKYGATVVTVGREDETFFVKDNGIGIAEAYLEQVFDLFKRLHTYDEYHGSGIGLSLCRRIVETHRGKIWVESIPGVETTFYFTLGEGGTHGPK